MKYVFTEKKAQVGKDVQPYAEKKIGKLDRFFKGEADAFVTFSTVRGRETAEVTIRSNGMIYRATETTGDMCASIDSAVATIEQQIRKNKSRLEKRLREGVIDKEFKQISVDDEDEAFDIIRTKRFSIKPMTTEEAILQMNLLGHEFFVFRNHDNDAAFAVVYRRNGGGYGLIESDD
ncbi:MAG: ribosome-associated translation inhibitor RaiA [Bacillota bacterium]|nr:ribosome-associated translation inhibitor RaiA [Bacillota bacterium]